MEPQGGTVTGNTELRQKAFTLFCQCLCGKESSFRELQILARDLSGEENYTVGTRVKTHSLSSTEFNDLTGVISGEAVMKKGVMRFPVTLEMNDSEQIIALKIENLSIVYDSSSFNECDEVDILVVKGYCGLFCLANENPLIVTDKDSACASLKNIFSQHKSNINVSCPHFQYLVGESYEYGIPDTVTRDCAQAIGWFRLAADQGHAAAQCELGYCLHNGEGIDLNYADGVKYYSQAAEQNFAKAQYYMGVANFYGQGVETEGDEPEDYEEAVRWYLLSADQGYSAAQTALGFCYQVGRGCNISIPNAKKYFQQAADQGDAYAAAKLDSLKHFIPS